MNLAIPSQRNRDIFHKVHIVGCSLRQVATEFGISPTRVVEICKQVDRWRVSTLPQQLAEKPPAVLLLDTCYRQMERLDEMYQQAHALWETACNSLNSSTDSNKDFDRRMRLVLAGEPRHVAQATRIVREQIHIAAVIAQMTEEMIEKAKQVPRLEMLPDPCAEEEASDMTSPPASGCAPQKAIEATPAAEAPQDESVSVFGDVFCEVFAEHGLLGNRGEKPGDPPVRLTRAERKRRQKQLVAASNRRLRQEAEDAKQRRAQLRDQLR